MTTEELRRKLGLPELKPGMVKCLGWCNEEFYSWDKNQNRICPACRKKQRSLEGEEEEPQEDSNDIVEIDEETWAFCNDNQDLIDNLITKYI